MSVLLETERLILRPPGRQDLGQFVPLIGDYEVAKNLLRAPHPYTEEDGRKFLLASAYAWAKGGDFVFSVLVRDARLCIGMCGVHPAQGWEIGYWLGRPHWGNGYATEAIERLVRFAFDKGAERLTARWFHDNPASGRVLAKLGFSDAGEDAGFSLARKEQVKTHVVALARANRVTGRLAA